MLSLERSLSLPFPKHERLFAFLAAQLGGDSEERAVECVFRKFPDTDFGNSRTVISVNRVVRLSGTGKCCKGCQRRYRMGPNLGLKTGQSV